MDLLLCAGEVRPPMQEGGQFGAGMLVGEAVVGDERVGLQHRLEPLARVAGLVAEFGELGRVGGDLAFVPGNQDRFDVWEVLVERRSAICDIVTDSRPCLLTSAAVVSRIASRTAARCAWMVSSHSLGTPPVYVMTIWKHPALI
jgi:hypothetical protein